MLQRVQEIYGHVWGETDLLEILQDYTSKSVEEICGHSMRGIRALPIERDIHFSAQELSAVKRRHHISS